jgi:hypothetical protein
MRRARPAANTHTTTLQATQPTYPSQTAGDVTAIKIRVSGVRVPPPSLHRLQELPAFMTGNLRSLIGSYQTARSAMNCLLADKTVQRPKDDVGSTSAGPLSGLMRPGVGLEGQRTGVPREPTGPQDNTRTVLALLRTDRTAARPHVRGAPVAGTRAPVEVDDIGILLKQSRVARFTLKDVPALVLDDRIRGSTHAPARRAGHWGNQAIARRRRGAPAPCRRYSSPVCWRASAKAMARELGCLPQV